MVKENLVYVTALFKHFFFLIFADPNEEGSELQSIKIEVNEYDSEGHEEVLDETNHKEELYEEITEQDEDLIEELQTEPETEEKDMYTCNLCQVNFYSIDDHVAQYHEDQQVIVEVSWI